MVGTWSTMAEDTGRITGSGAPSQSKNQQMYPAEQPSYPVGSGSAATPMTNENGTNYYPTRSTADTGAIGSSSYIPPNYATLVAQQQAAQQQASLGPLQDLVNAYYGPQQTLLSQQLARQQDQLGLIGVTQDHTNANLYRDNNLALRGLALDRQANGLESSLAQGQLGNLGKLRDILAKQRGLTREQFDNQMAGFKIDETKARDQADRAQWDLRSDLTARGAFNTVANERGTGRINRDLIYTLGGINNQRSAADIQFRNQLLGLDEKGIGYDNQQLALNNKLANIGLDAKRLDLSEEQLNNALADGLWNSGMSAYANMNQVLDAIGSTNQSQAALGMEMLQTILGYSNLPPDVIASLTAALTGKQQQGAISPHPTGKPRTPQVRD